MNGHIRPARRRWKGVQRDKSLWRRLRKTARRAGGRNGYLSFAGIMGKRGKGFAHSPPSV